MQNRNGTLTRRTSPNLDPVFLGCIILSIAILALVGWGWVRPAVAVASLHCPAPDHAMWAGSIGQAICGTGQTIGVKSR